MRALPDPSASRPVILGTMNELRLDDALFLLNEHLGDTVTLRLSHSPDEFPSLHMLGKLALVRAELLPEMTGATPSESEELGTVYWLDGPERLIDLAQLRTHAAPITGSDHVGVVIARRSPVTSPTPPAPRL
jgi:hypothetical protein